MLRQIISGRGIDARRVGTGWTVCVVYRSVIRRRL